MDSMEFESRANSDAHVDVCRNEDVRKFTWRDLSNLNEAQNAHIAYRGKVH